MKKPLAILAFLLTTQLAFAQYFTLTPSGFISTKEKSDYTVVEVPNTNQVNLYKNVLNAVSTIYKNPKEVLSLVDGESITIKGYEEKTIVYKDKISPIQIGKTTYKYDLSYNLSILFKDGKIRFNKPTFECRRWYQAGYKSGWANGWTYLHIMEGKNAKNAIFDKNEKIFSEEAYQGVNNYFNMLIKDIIDKSGNINNW